MRLIVDLISHIFPFFSLIEFCVIMRWHVPHLGSSHLLTVELSVGELNSAIAKCCVRFFGWRRLTTYFLLSIMVFILAELLRILRSCMILPTTCGLFELCVIVRDSVLMINVLCFVDLRFSDRIDFSFFMPYEIIVFRSFCFCRNLSNSWRRLSRISSLDTIQYVLPVSEYGMLCFISFGWQDLKCKYCIDRRRFLCRIYRCAGSVLLCRVKCQ